MSDDTKGTYGDAIGSLVDQSRRLAKVEWERDELRARVTRLTEQLQYECPHGEMSWSGVDQNDGDDKIWRCDNCGKEGTDAQLRADKDDDL